MPTEEIDSEVDTNETTGGTTETSGTVVKTSDQDDGALDLAASVVTSFAAAMVMMSL